MKHFVYTLALVMSLLSCKKEEANCFDPALQKQYEAVNCVQDCPGVIGCDGKNYCNECIANSQGIRVK